MATKNKKETKPTQAVKPLSIKKAFSKREIAQTIAEITGLAKKQAAAAIDSLTHIIGAHISKKGPGVFIFPGIAKFYVAHKPATKKREGKNPFTGEQMTFAAKPARNVVRIRPLKKLKDAVK